LKVRFFEKKRVILIWLCNSHSKLCRTSCSNYPKANWGGKSL